MVDLTIELFWFFKCDDFIIEITVKNKVAFPDIKVLVLGQAPLVKMDNNGSSPVDSNVLLVNCLCAFPLDKSMDANWRKKVLSYCPAGS